jgi:hypothetical protein
MHGSNWPQNKIDNNMQKKDVNKALTFSNHKGETSQPLLLQQLIVKYITSIQGALLAPMNMMKQNKINEQGQINSPTIKVMFGDWEPLSTAMLGLRTSFHADLVHAYDDWLTTLLPPVRNTQTGEFWQQRLTTNLHTVTATWTG